MAQIGFNTKNGLSCLTCLLMIFNILFWLSGITILYVGIWMKFGLRKYMEMSTEFSQKVPNILIAVGAVIILIGLLACYGTLKGQSVLLCIYGGTLALNFVLELYGGISIYAYNSKLTEGFDSGLTQAMKNYYNDTDIAADFDAIQKKLHCCGNHKPNDWLNTIPPKIPKSCCIDENCNTDDDSQIYKEGCFNKVVSFLNSNIGIVATAAVCVAFFPLIGLFLACCLAWLLNTHASE